MTKRNIAVCIILSIVTCGIYGIYWFIVMTNDANTASEHTNDTSGGVAFLLTLVTCGIYGLYWSYKMGEKLTEAKTKRGMPVGSNLSIAYLLLSLFGFSIITYALAQNELNQLAN